MGALHISLSSRVSQPCLVISGRPTVPTREGGRWGPSSSLVEGRHGQEGVVPKREARDVRRPGGAAQSVQRLPVRGAEHLHHLTRDARGRARASGAREVGGGEWSGGFSVRTQ